MPKFYSKQEGSEAVKKPGLIINYRKVSTTFLMVLALTGTIGYVGYNLYNAGKHFVQAFPAIAFAYQYPELVEPLRDQYTTEWNALKDSMIKRQSLISPLPEAEQASLEMGKDLSQ